MNEVGAYYEEREYKPTFIERVKRRLFPFRHGDDLPDRPQWKGWWRAIIRVKFSWADRLRILVSGGMVIDMRCQAMESVDTIETVQDVFILAPGETYKA